MRLMRWRWIDGLSTGRQGTLGTWVSNLISGSFGDYQRRIICGQKETWLAGDLGQSDSDSVEHSIWVGYRWLQGEEIT